MERLHKKWLHSSIPLPSPFDNKDVTHTLYIYDLEASLHPDDLYSIHELSLPASEDTVRIAVAFRVFPYTGLKDVMFASISDRRCYTCCLHYRADYMVEPPLISRRNTTETPSPHLLYLLFFAHFCVLHRIYCYKLNVC